MLHTAASQCAHTLNECLEQHERAALQRRLKREERHGLQPHYALPKYFPTKPAQASTNSLSGSVKVPVK